MKKKRLILSFVLGLSLLAYSGFSFADGPDLDDRTMINSGPGIGLGKNDNKINVADSYLQVYSGVLSGENVPLLSNYGFSGYAVYGYNEMSADLFKLKEAYPSLQLSSLGKTVDGRELYCGIVGNPNAPKKILVHASIHAREYIVTKVAMRQMASLLEMEKNDQKYGGKSTKALLQNCAVYFVPMVDPDGVALVQNGLAGIGSEEVRNTIQSIAAKENPTDLNSYFRLWKSNARGVNLNKNFDANWSITVDKKGYPAKDEYKGSAAESEIESKALADLLRKEKFTSTISYHTQGEVIYWYFGEGEYVPKARRLAEIVHKNSSYPVIDYYAPQHAGGFKDFAEQKYQIPSLTIECGKGVSPVPEEQIDKIWEGQKGILPDLLYDYMT